jgi:hypothetical protein
MMNVAVQIDGDASLAEHPFVTRLSRLMKLGAADLRNLELIFERQRLVKNDRIWSLSATSIAIFVSSETATRSATSCFATARGRYSM